MTLFSELSFVHLGREEQSTDESGIGVVALSSSFPAARKCPMLVMHDPIKTFIDRGTSVFQKADASRIIGQGQDGFLEFIEVNVNDFGVLGLGIGFHENRIGQPFFHASNATFNRTNITVSFVNHPLEHDNVRLEVFNDWFLVQLDGATGRRTFRRASDNSKACSHLSSRETFNFQNASRKDIFLLFRGDRQESHLNGRVRNGLHQITKRNARLHFSRESHKHTFGHVQRHDSRRGRKGHQSGTGRKRNSNGKTRMAVTTGTDRIGQEHAIQPRMNNTIAGTQTNTTAGHDKVGQGCDASPHQPVSDRPPCGKSTA